MPSGSRAETVLALRAKEQDFGTQPTTVRESEHYQAEYIQSFVEKWDELIDWGHAPRARGASSSNCSRRAAR